MLINHLNMAWDGVLRQKKEENKKLKVKEGYIC